MDIVDYIYDECHRQHVTNYGDFAKALHSANAGPNIELASMMGDDPVRSFQVFVMGIAEMVEPDVNTYNFENNLRTSHVGFMHGGSAAPANDVRRRFDRWCNILFQEMKDYKNGTVQDYIDGDESFADVWIKDLLDIHPWADGNGRTASILRNWMLGTLDDPSPLPYYYGES